MVASVGPTDGGGIDTSLTRSCEWVCADSNPCGGRVYWVAGEGLEVQPEGNN